MSELLMHPMGGGTGSDDVTATSANVLSGKTAVTNDSDDEAIEGTMANNGAMDVTLTPAGNGTTSKEVAEGYYSGGTITADGAAAYSAGHSQGVTDADNRVNTSSASYNSGYANGKAIDRIVAASISGSHAFDISRFNDKSAGAFIIALPQSSSGSWTLLDWGGSHTDTIYINISKSVSGNTLSTNVVAGLSGNNVPFSYAPVYSVYYIGTI